MQNMFPLPHQVNMNRPPPPLMPENDMIQQRKSWIHNNQNSNDEDGNMNPHEAPPSLLGMPPSNFMPQNHHGNFQGNFRGNRRGGGSNGSPYNNNFRGGRGSNRARGRGGFRGKFTGQTQW